jgi:hypothetical protein
MLFLVALTMVSCSYQKPPPTLLGKDAQYTNHGYISTRYISATWCTVCNHGHVFYSADVELFSDACACRTCGTIYIP